MTVVVKFLWSSQTTLMSQRSRAWAQPESRDEQEVEQQTHLHSLCTLGLHVVRKELNRVSNLQGLRAK